MSIFKSVNVYKASGDTQKLPVVELEKLMEHQFKSIGDAEEFSVGWQSVFPDNDAKKDELIHSVNGDLKIIALRIDSKVIPGDSVKQLVKQKIKELEAQEGGPIGKKRQNELKDQVIFELLPRALVKTSVIKALLDYQHHRIIVDGSSSAAEKLLSHLRKTIGSLPVIPLKTANDPSGVMTHWLAEKTPTTVKLDNNALLFSVETEQSKVQLKNVDLLSQEVVNHINNGYRVDKISICWAEKLNVTIDKALSFKSIKLTDIAMEGVDRDADNEVEEFDANVLLFNGVFSEFFDDAMQWFGGLV